MDHPSGSQAAEREALLRQRLSLSCTGAGRRSFPREAFPAPFLFIRRLVRQDDDMLYSVYCVPAPKRKGRFLATKRPAGQPTPKSCAAGINDGGEARGKPRKGEEICDECSSHLPTDLSGVPADRSGADPATSARRGHNGNCASSAA